MYLLAYARYGSLHPGSYDKSIRSVAAVAAAAVATCDDGDSDDDDDDTYGEFTDRFQTLKAFYNFKRNLKLN